MIKIEAEKLKNIFTMEDKEIGKMCGELEIDPFDVLQAIITFTTNPEDIQKVDTFSQIVYVAKEAYRQGFLAALYYGNEINKEAVQALIDDKEVIITA